MTTIDSTHPATLMFPAGDKKDREEVGMTFFRIGVPITVVVVVLSSVVSAQEATGFPSKSVRIIVAQPPGGAIDTQARLFAAKMSESLGQQFIVENRVAANIVVFTTLTKSTPDGYTLLAVNPEFTIAPSLFKGYPDPIKDFAPVSLVTRSPFLLVVNASTPVKSVKELVTLAHSQPGKLNFGGGNLGTGPHLVTMYFLAATNIKATYVPYKGTGPALVDLLGGRIDGIFSSVLSSGPLVKSGKLRAIGITTIERSKVLTDIPTIAEQGVPGYDAATFHGYLAPVGTPNSIIAKLSSEFARSVKSPEIVEKLAGDGGEPVGSTPEQFRKVIFTEIQRWRKVVKDAGITVTE